MNLQLLKIHKMQKRLQLKSKRLYALIIKQDCCKTHKRVATALFFIFKNSVILKGKYYLLDIPINTIILLLLNHFNKGVFMLNIITQFINSCSDDIRTFTDALWHNPETAYNETFAVKSAIELLAKYDYKVITPYCNIETAFRTEFDNGCGPTFAIAAEYDALPVIGHGCGHNLIAGAAIASFLAAADLMKQKNIKGKLILFGTPAEEGGGGKVKMVEAGCLEGVDAVMMVHPSNRTVADNGSTSNIGLEVIFHGKATHAAAAPEKGINALDAVNLVFTGVNTYRQYIPEHARIHGVIIEGGKVPNVIPDYAKCDFYLRSADESWCPVIEKRFRDIVKGAELMTGATAELNYFRPTYRARKPNKVMNKEYLRCMQALNVEVSFDTTPGRGSSDFGNFSQIRPGIHPYFNISEKPISSHSTEMTAASGSNYGFERALDAAAAQANIAYRFLSDETFRNAVIEDFKK